MPRVMARVGNREIIGSGSVLFWVSDKVEIYPFEDDQEFSIIFIFIALENKMDPHTIFDVDDSGKLIIKYNRYLDGSGISGNMTTAIATDNDYRYVFSFTVDLSGNSEKTAINLVYSVSRIRKDV